MNKKIVTQITAEEFAAKEGDWLDRFGSNITNVTYTSRCADLIPCVDRDIGMGDSEFESVSLSRNLSFYLRKIGVALVLGRLRLKKIFSIFGLADSG